MLNNITFLHPYAFYFLPIFIICDRFCKLRYRSYYMPHLDFFEHNIKRKTLLLSILKYTIILFAIIALASPVKYLKIIEHTTKDKAIILSIPQKNLANISNDIKKFIQNIEATKIGIVLYDNSVIIVSPLSYDKNIQYKIIDDLSSKNYNADILATKNSIEIAKYILEKNQASSKIIVNITDKEEEITRLSKSIKLYNIDPNKLQQIAKEENSKITIESKKIYSYLFFYPLMVSFLSLLIYIYKKN